MGSCLEKRFVSCCTFKSCINNSTRKTQALLQDLPWRSIQDNNLYPMQLLQDQNLAHPPTIWMLKDAQRLPAEDSCYRIPRMLTNAAFLCPLSNWMTCGITWLQGETKIWQPAPKQCTPLTHQRIQNYPSPDCSLNHLLQVQDQNHHSISNDSWHLLGSLNSVKIIHKFDNLLKSISYAVEIICL